jgi:hypothetical protein
MRPLEQWMLILTALGSFASAAAVFGASFHSISLPILIGIGAVSTTIGLVLFIVTHTAMRPSAVRPSGSHRLRFAAIAGLVVGLTFLLFGILAQAGQPGSLQAQTSMPPDSTPASNAPAPPPQSHLPPHPTCFDTVFSSIPADHIAVIKGDNTWQRVGLARSGGLDAIGGEYGVLLNSNLGNQFAVRVNVDAVNQQYTVETFINGSCQSTGTAPASRAMGSTVDVPDGLYSELCDFLRCVRGAAA